MLRSISERDILRDRMTVRAVPQIGLKGLPAEEAIPRLRDAWAQTFMPHDGHLDIGLKFVARARAFASVRYRQMQSYQEERYEGVLPGLSESESLEVWCLTGLAGVSKTSLFAALRRAFEPAAGDWVPTPGIHIHPRPVVHIQIKPKQTADEVVRALANPLFVAGRTNIKWVDMKRHLHDWLHGQMTALVFLDELQFLSRSESASTLIANLVSQLADLGFPLTYGCNFSLGHKLVGRQHEDKDRLLTHPLVLQPPRIDDSHWAHVVAEYQCAAVEMVDLDPRRDAPELYRLCGGLYRVLRLLLIASCRMAWPSKADRPISMPDIRAAYRSHLFASQRADIEALNTMYFLRRQERSVRTCLAPSRVLVLQMDALRRLPT